MVKKKKEYVEGDEIAKEFEKNPNDWKSLSKAQQDAMRAQLQSKEKRVSIRISAEVLQKLREKAALEGLAYQTYINSVLFKIAYQEDTISNLQKRLHNLESEVKKIKKVS